MRREIKEQTVKSSLFLLLFDRSISSRNMSRELDEAQLNKQIFNMSLENDYEVNEEEEGRNKMLIATASTRRRDSLAT